MSALPVLSTIERAKRKLFDLLVRLIVGMIFKKMDMYKFLYIDIYIYIWDYISGGKCSISHQKWLVLA